MSHTFIFSLGVVLISAFTAARAVPADLSGFAETLRAELGVPALAVTATNSEGLTAAGVAGVRATGGDDPARITDRWHLGSLTKSMTATVAARLVERGTIRWDATIAELDPELAASVPEAHRTVTLGQLLAHRAGLPDDRFSAPLQMKMWTLEGPPEDQRRVLVPLLFAQPGVTSAGETMRYTNGGYMVAGWMLETVAGEAWESLIQRELFEPLGMDSAGFGPPGMDPGQGAQPLGHGRGPDGPVPVPAVLGADNPPPFGPAGRVHCSITDLAAYARLHLRGLRGEDTGYLPHEAFVRLHADPEGDGYALGWGVVGEGDDRRSTHTGSNTRWLALILVWPARDLAIVAATNAVPQDAAHADVLARLIDAATNTGDRAP